jgi:hypothetical protein
MRNSRRVLLTCMLSILFFIAVATGWGVYRESKIINYGLCDRRIYSLEAKASTTVTIHADQGFYKERFTQERIYRGVLGEIPEEEDGNYIFPLDPIFFRPFILRQENGEEIPLYRWDTKDRALVLHLGAYVEICGKYVKLDREAGGRKELWVGYLTPLAPSSR